MGGIVGFVLFTLASYVLFVINVPFLIIPVTLLGMLLVAKPFSKELKQAKIRFDSKTILVAIVFVIGTIGQILVISPSGIFQNGSLVFWSSNGHDGAWHIALMEEIKKGYPFQNPVFAGEKLVNYHFFSDIAPAIISKYTPISDLDLYFRIFPFIYSVFFGASAYFLTKKLTGSFSASIWATIFTYFAGSFGYVIGKGESVFWATQPQSSSGNPPQIVSDFIVLAGLYFLLILLQKKGGKLIFAICVLLFGTLAEFKVYAAVEVLSALFIAGVWQLLREKKTQLLLLSITSGALAAVLYLPNTSGSGSFLIFQPWWYIRTMIVEPSRLNLLDWELRRQTYIYEHNWKRVIFLEGLGFLIFFFGNLGMRFVGLWDATKFAKSSLKNYFNLVYILIVIFSIALPLLFLQKGVASNTSQFLQYYVLLLGILAGITTARLLKFVRIKILQIVIGATIIVAMVPTQVALLHEFYGSLGHFRQPFAKISELEIEALTYIKKNTSPSAVLLTPPFDQYPKLNGSTPNIWDWSDTAYVSAFSARKTYFDDHEQVDIMGYEWKQRLALKELVFTSKDQALVKAKINESKAQIVYFPKVFQPQVDFSKIGLSKVFENREIEVWQVK